MEACGFSEVEGKCERSGSGLNPTAVLESAAGEMAGLRPGTGRVPHDFFEGGLAEAVTDEIAHGGAHGVALEFSAFRQGKNCGNGCEKERVSCESSQEGEEGTRIGVEGPEVSEDAEDGDCGVQGIQFPEVLERMFAIGEGLFGEAVVFDYCVSEAAWRIGGRYDREGCREILEHDRAARMSADVAKTEADGDGGGSVWGCREERVGVLGHGLGGFGLGRFQSVDLQVERIDVFAEIQGHLFRFVRNLPAVRQDCVGPGLDLI